MRIVVFGANGPTGREVTDQALAAGHQAVAVTRHPEEVAQRQGLTVVKADAFDAAAVATAVAGGDAVISALGVPYSRKRIAVYSQGTANIAAAMHRHGVKRLVVVSSAAVDPTYVPSDSFLFNRVMEPLFMRRPGRTLYDDLRRMEALVRDSDLDWTIIRPAWLFTSDAPTGAQIDESSVNGMYTARADLAACLLAQLDDDRFVRKAIGIVTTTATPTLIQQIWRENIRAKKLWGR